MYPYLTEFRDGGKISGAVLEPSAINSAAKFAAPKTKRCILPLTR